MKVDVDEPATHPRLNPNVVAPDVNDGLDDVVFVIPVNKSSTLFKMNPWTLAWETLWLMSMKQETIMFKAALLFPRDFGHFFRLKKKNNSDNKKTKLTFAIKEKDECVENYPH